MYVCIYIYAYIYYAYIQVARMPRLIQLVLECGGRDVEGEAGGGSRQEAGGGRREEGGGREGRWRRREGGRVGR